MTDDVLDNKRKIATAIQAGYDTAGIRKNLVEVMIGYPDLVNQAALLRIRETAMKLAVKDREADLLAGVSGSNETTRKANFALACKTDEGLKALIEEQTVVTADLAKLEASIEARRFEMRRLEALSTIVAAEITALGVA